MNVIFDATIIANYFNKNACSSGIFFAARNILEGLLERPGVHVMFYFFSEMIGKALTNRSYSSSVIRMKEPC